MSVSARDYLFTVVYHIFSMIFAFSFPFYVLAAALDALYAAFLRSCRSLSAPIPWPVHSCARPDELWNDGPERLLSERGAARVYIS